MPFNVLLLPLLGGYLFIIHWNRTRYKAQRHSGYRLLFNAAVAGVILMAISLPVTGAIAQVFPGLEETWEHWVPFPFVGTSATAFLLGWLSPLLLNRWYPEDTEISRTISEFDDFLEILLEKALKETKNVSVTLKSGKVYIGLVTSNINPAYDRRYLGIMPVFSGYRDQRDQSLHMTTDYSSVLAKIVHGEETFSHLDHSDFEIILPVSELQSINIFDRAAYELFLKEARQS